MAYQHWSYDTLHRLCMEAFQKFGFTEAEADIIQDVLLTADLYGIESHGMQRMVRYHKCIEKGMIDVHAKPEVVFETPISAVIDAHEAMGQLVSHKAMEMAIDKAKKCGMGMVAVRNSTHYGIAGYYATMCTAQDCIGITGTNARPSIAPTNGVENMLGTNPLTFGIPTDEEFPFVLDCATSISQRGKIEYFARNGMPTPAGMVIGENGETLTDSQQILKDLTTGKAALAPIGGVGEGLAGYKGYGYASVVEILCAALQAGSFLKMLTGRDSEGNAIPYPLGHFFIAIDTEAFLGAESFKKTTGEILRELRASKKAPGCDRIYTAGEKEHDVWMERKDKGVPMAENVQREFAQLREDYGLPKEQFLFPFEK